MKDRRQTVADLRRLAHARNLLASGYVREVREAHHYSLRGCAEAIEGEGDEVSHVALLRWERGLCVPRRRADAAIRYVDLIERLARGDAP